MGWFCCLREYRLQCFPVRRGKVQLIGGFSLLGGNAFGRVIAVIGGTLGALGALLSVGGAYPWWSLSIFFLCIWVTWGVIVLGEDENASY